MATEISVVTNCDDAVIFWRTDKPIKDCYGFAIERERKTAGGVERKTLDNMTGFAKDKPRQGEHRPSTVWPFQRYWWADHSANAGDKVRYRATPMVRKPGADLVQDLSGRSGWTPWVELTGDAGDGIASYFNRGLVISQFMARYLDELRRKKNLKSMDATLAEFKKSLDDHELPIRRFLSGELRKEMLALVADARKSGKHVYGALYELDDDELLDALEALKGRGHIVLANGSITAAKGEGVANARKRDENKAARKRLQDAGLEVFGRFVSPGALGHNKFLVVASASGKAQAAWTGSTNWTKTGLCTQSNNGLLVENAAFADEYLQQWKRLRDAKNEFPDALVQANAKPKKVSVGKSRSEIWFTRAPKDIDLAAIDGVIKGAEKAVLFLMFQPGNKGALGTVKKMLESPGKRYIKGVVSTLPPESAQAEDHVDVSIHTGATRHTVGLDIVQPEGFSRPFANWAATVTRKDFLPHKIAGGASGGIGYAIVHSKLIVVDPFTKPVVITGSHNFSSSASEKNDENFVIVRGNKDLALDYAAHILSVYHHYRWLAFVNDMQAKGKDPKSWLDENDEWQKISAEGRKELDFWLGS